MPSYFGKYQHWWSVVVCNATSCHGVWITLGISDGVVQRVCISKMCLKNGKHIDNPESKTTLWYRTGRIHTDDWAFDIFWTMGYSFWRLLIFWYGRPFTSGILVYWRVCVCFHYHPQCINALLYWKFETQNTCAIIYSSWNSVCCLEFFISSSIMSCVITCMWICHLSYVSISITFWPPEFFLLVSKTHQL